MIRLFTKNATGVATDGRWYAGDINAIQDAVAALTDLTQAHSVGTLAIGEAGLQLVRYGTGEARISGAFRTDGIIRGLGGLFAGSFTTSARDAIPTGFAPYGLIILNTTTNSYQWNSGTDTSRVWLNIGGGSFTSGLHGARPSPSAANANALYFETDTSGGTLFASTGAAWVQVALGLSQAGTVPPDSITAVELAPRAVTGVEIAPQVISSQAGSYSLVASDRFKLIVMNGGGTLTVPLNSSQAFFIGDSVDILQGGASQVTIAPAAGVTLVGNPGLKFAGQYMMVTLIKTGTDSWFACGALTP